MSARGIGGVGPIHFEHHDESSFQSKNDKNSVSTTRVSPRIASFVWCCQEKPLPQKCTQIAKLYSAAMDICAMEGKCVKCEVWRPQSLHTGP
jgi:hypothetical protein